MKSTMKKALVSACLASTFLCGAAVSGALLLTSQNNSSVPNAASLSTTTDIADTLTTPSKLVIESDTTSLAAGDTFKIHLTFMMTDTTRQWFALESTITALDENGNPDTNLFQYLSVEGNLDGTTDWKRPLQYDFNFYAYNTLAADRFKTAVIDGEDLGDNGHGLFVGMGFGSGLEVSTSVACEWEFTLKVSEDIPTSYTELRLGMNSNYAFNYVNTITGSNANTQLKNPAVSEDGTKHEFSSNVLVLPLGSQTTETNVDKITIGGIQDEEDNDLPDIEITSDDITSDGNGGGSATITLPDTPDQTVVIKPLDMMTDSTGATAEVAVNGSTTTKPAVGDYTSIGSGGEQVTVTGDNNIIHVSVTAQDGGKTGEYVITVVFTYVRLDDLDATSTLPTASPSTITKNGLEETFDRDTFVYTVNIPENAVANTTKVTPTVVSGYGASETVNITKLSGSCTVPSSVQSGNDFTVSNVADNDEIKLTVTANDGTTTKDYTVTFKILSIEDGLDEDAEGGAIQVKGVHLQKASVNDATKATAKGVDYYFNVVDDVKPVKALMTVLTEDSNATVEVKESSGSYAAHTNDVTQYAMGTYKVKVTAAAGNYTEYDLILITIDALRLADNTYVFVHMLKSIVGTQTQVHRVAYQNSKLNWTHGIDDVNNPDVERVMITDIMPNTNLSTLVSHIDSTQLSSVRIYNMSYDATTKNAVNCGTGNLLVYNNGSVVSGLTPGQQTVGTGWRIEYGSGDNVDIVYVSVLGDVNGDGAVNMTDSSMINSYYIGNKGVSFDLTQRCAAAMTNDGIINMTDSSTLNAWYAGNKGVVIENLFCSAEL